MAKISIARYKRHKKEKFNNSKNMHSTNVRKIYSVRFNTNGYKDEVFFKYLQNIISRIAAFAPKV